MVLQLISVLAGALAWKNADGEGVALYVACVAG